MTSYITENKYNEDMQSRVEPNWDLGTIAYFQGHKDLRLRYGFFPAKDGKKSIILLSGQAEFMERYKELIYDFNARGFDVFTYDHRGQGGSDKVSKIKKTTDVEDFWDYVTDLEIFIREVVGKKLSGLPIVFGHSMGGAIAAGYLSKYPEKVAKAILNAPMLGIISPLPLVSDKASHKIATVLGSLPILSTQRAPGARKISDLSKFLKLEVTHSEKRFQYLAKMASRRPELVIDIAAATYRMGGEAYKFLSELFAEGVIESISTKILITQASHDTLVSNEAMSDFQKRAPNCEIFMAKPDHGDSYHELHFETDSIRKKTLDAYFDFLGV